MAIARLVAGNQLSPRAQAQVKARFVHRPTFENPNAINPQMNDAAWFQVNAFHVRQDGLLDGRYAFCHPISHQTVRTTKCWH